MVLRWVDIRSLQSGTLGVRVKRVLNYRDERGRFVVTGPLDQIGLVAPGRGGFVVEGEDPYEIEVYDGTGHLSEIFRLSDPGDRLDPEDAFDLFIGDGPGSSDTRKILSILDLPKRLPSFQTLLVDELSWYWAELFRVGEGQTAEWLVFNPAGVAQGIVEFSTDFDVHHVGATYVLGVWDDELGVEHIRRYAVNRGGDQ